MELPLSSIVQAGMKRDGRILAHNTLNEMRVVAVQRLNEREYPEAFAAAFGLHRSWAYKSLTNRKGLATDEIPSLKGKSRTLRERVAGSALV